MLNNNKYLLLVLFTTATVFFGCKKNVSNDKDKTNKDSIGVVKNDTAISINLDNPIADEKIILRFQPEIGSKYVVESNVSMSLDESQDTFKISYKSKKYGKVNLKILAKDKENYKIEFVLVDTRENIKTDTTTIDYQYNKPLADPSADINRKIEDCLVNSPLTILMTPSGEALDILGYEAIIAKVKAVVGQQNIPDQMIAAQLGTPTEHLENYFLNYPDTAIKIGDKWTIVTASQMQGVPITLTNHYTLADRKDGIAYINFQVDIAIDKSAIPADVAAKMTNIKFSAYIKGTGEVEEKSGWPKLIKVTQGVNLSDEFEGHVTTSKQFSSSVIKWIQ